MGRISELDDVERTALGVPAEEPITPEEERLLALETDITEALLAAEETARRCGEEDLADCLDRLELIWGLGGVSYAVALLDRARKSCLEALREVTDEEKG